MELVPAALVHAELLAAMHRISFAEPWTAASMAELLAMPGAGGVIAVAGGRLTAGGDGDGPAGFVLYRAAAGESEILTIMVLPPWRRHGLGSLLLDAAVAECRQRGAGEMFLEVAADNAAALALYSRHGFETVGLRKGYYAGKDALTMKKTIPALQH